MYAIIKQIELYKERLEPAWEYLDPNEQRLFAEKVNEYADTEYNVLYVCDDNTYKEVRGLKSVPASALEIARDDLDYDDTKRRLKNEGFSKDRRQLTAAPFLLTMHYSRYIITEQMFGDIFLIGEEFL